MSGTLALAAQIAAMDRQALAQLAAGRRIASPATVHEPLGLAIELLRPDSISRALQSLHRGSLEALQAVAEERAADPAILESLAAIGLLGVSSDKQQPSPSAASFVALPEVTEALPSLPSPASLPSSESLPSPAPLPIATELPAQQAPAPEDFSGWFAPALTSVRRAAKMLHTIATHPVRLGRKGRPAVVAVRDLAEAAHCMPEQTGRLLDTMHAAGLLRSHRNHIGTEQLGVAEPAAHRWLMQSDYAARWLDLAGATISWFDSRLRRGIAETGGDLRAAAYRLPHDYPLLPEGELASLVRVAETAEDLGLTLHGWVTPAARALLQGDKTKAGAITESDIPGNVPGVYLQPDLSIIVPGPLPPTDEAILSAISETEQLGPAASLRVSTDRLTRAVLRAGSGTGEIRQALERLSLTGIPQPLDYLLRDLDRRAIEHAKGFEGTSDSVLHNSTELPSPARAPSWTPAEPPPAPVIAKPAPSHEQQVQEMIDRVLAAASDAGSEGDLTRRLELAIRDRSPVRVTAVAGKDEREFTLLPVSLKGGRLRATDQLAGVERTLPVSAITAVDMIAA